MGGHHAVGTPSGARRGSADGKIALGLQSQTSVRQAASAPRSLALGGLSSDPLRRMFFGSVTRYPRLTIEINLAENLVDHRVISLCHRDVTMMPFD
jgi:hypothetical protein